MYWIASSLVLITVVFSVWQPFIWKIAGIETPPSALSDIQSLTTLMSIVLALMALGVSAFGFLVYQLIERQLKEHLEGDYHRGAIGNYLTSGQLMYMLYEGKEPKNSADKISIELLPIVNASIFAAEKALTWAEKMKLPSRERGEFIAKAQNHLAYHLATKGDSKDEGRARQLAEQILAAAPKYNNGRDFRDTALWVYYRYPSVENPGQARQIFQNLMKDRAASQADHDELRAKYPSF